MFITPSQVRDIFLEIDRLTIQIEGIKKPVSICSTIREKQTENKKGRIGLTAKEFILLITDKTGRPLPAETQRENFYKACLLQDILGGQLEIRRAKYKRRGR